ncbi:U3-containing 90S pre-ribosomal complex subunit-domain containing protein [Piptocephalis cylindrospora]|uniref:U3-containing 90S pre-ribosomal complex subunit-domain containing protein n=1 Tax=Piptocephalis cylindrospora TaxID=1907219 RepID=A0A4P9Y5C1_9FUNG|nr:U3-containing 90S pre-ribosomal complex subunit-domain containing protein [Piptocephalis cylindrospora]|eukprot:RKP14135.1 U3-containing 90S pre-ribosomal complex subunit-domain containing protein [Piptocephalis cylindrospora]
MAKESTKKKDPALLADDLEDNFVLDDAYAPSEGEDVEEEAPSKKREASSSTEAPGQKKRKKKNGRRFDIKPTPSTISEQAEMLQSCRRAAFPRLSRMELEDLMISEDRFVDTTELDSVERRTDLEALPKFIHTFLPSWKQKLMANVSKAEVKASPIILVISSSGQRCADRVRELANFHAKCRVAKLFAKHFKVDQQKEYLAKVTCRIAVGTPNRLIKLASFNEGGLQLSRVELVFIDCQRDQKQRHVLDMDDTKEEAFRLLDGSLAQRIESGACRLILF